MKSKQKCHIYPACLLSVKKEGILNVHFQCNFLGGLHHHFYVPDIQRKIKRLSINVGSERQCRYNSEHSLECTTLACGIWTYYMSALYPILVARNRLTALSGIFIHIIHSVPRGVLFTNPVILKLNTFQPLTTRLSSATSVYFSSKFWKRASRHNPYYYRKDTFRVESIFCFVEYFCLFFLNFWTRISVFISFNIYGKVSRII